jgi:hypothetical protein
MALFRNRPAESAPVSLVASAAQVSLKELAWRSYKFGDDAWQQEAWRLYDVVPEFHAAADWVGNACAQVRIYVAEVDENGRIQQEVDAEKEPEIAALSETVLGGPVGRAEAVRMLGVSLVVVGETYIVAFARPDKNTDEWVVVSSSEIKRWQGGTWWKNEMERRELIEGQDLIIRVWTPHPKRKLAADCPGRALMPVLVEIEQLSKYINSQLNSRLIGGGLLGLSNQLDFPVDPKFPNGADSLYAKIYEGGTKAIRQDGDAQAVMPMLITGPHDQLPKKENLITFESVLSEQAVKLRDEARGRLMDGLPISPSTIGGAGDSNHWNGTVEREQDIKSGVEPFMVRICDALTKIYLRGALEALGKDPDRFVYWYDTSPLVVRPARFADTLNAFEKGLVSAETTLTIGDYKLSDAPSDEESARRWLRELVLREPALITTPEIRELVLGMDLKISPQTPVSTGPPPPPAPQRSLTTNEPNGLPQRSASDGNPTQTAVTAAGMELTLIGICESVTYRALELAGKRISTGTARDRYAAIPPHERHTFIAVTDRDKAAKVMDGAWDHLSALAPYTGLASDGLRNTLSEYCTDLLMSKSLHSTDKLVGHLRRAGVL